MWLEKDDLKYDKRVESSELFYFEVIEQLIANLY